MIARPQGEEWKLALMNRLRGVRRDDALLEGLRNVIAATFADTVEVSCNPQMAAEARTFNDGRQSACLDVLGQIDDAWKEANKPPEPKPEG